ncbi:hypothetical protein [Xenorhabdus anantnagensis]|uniref:Peptidase M10 metallopeptidase domain-containing protein n=1 Tax=Xenorhabdus anantnagensis TaxID=3025875 RepID=A0ABT5LV55_9GAMM|nr:hypothetical protein [Xenorhabdus anantnagensis]MDC9598210.1 hypothetical protein [Xenorhabdus anantnagensis]
MKKILLLLSIILYPLPSFTDDYPNIYRHVFSFAFNGQVYSPAAQFGNLLEYRVEIGHVHVNFEGYDPVLVDIQPLVERAAQMWDDRFASAGLPIRVREAVRPSRVNFSITIANGDQQEDLNSWGGLYGFTTPILPEEMLNDFRYQNFRLPGIVITSKFMISTKLYKKLKKIFGHDNRQAIADNMIYYAVVHEFGHAFGLAHPDFEGSRSFDNANTITEGLVESASSIENSTVPLMLSNGTYLGTLRRNLGRPITIQDIRPSSLELTGIAEENACGGSIPPRIKRNTFKTEKCKEKPRVFYPLAKAMLPVYQILL